MSKTSSKQRYECLVVWLEWFKKQPGYRKHIRTSGHQPTNK
jgi:hypothetical protein